MPFLIQCPHLNGHSPPSHEFYYSKYLQYFLRRSNIVLFFVDVFDRDSFDSASTDKRLVNLLSCNPSRSSHADKSEKCGRVLNLNGNLRRASRNFPIILWGYPNLIPVLFWMYSPNSLLLKHVNFVRRVLTLGGLGGLFLRNLHRRTAKTKHIVVIIVKYNAILSTCHPLSVSITLGILTMLQ